jgi:hypothetical protein
MDASPLSAIPKNQRTLIYNNYCLVYHSLYLVSGMLTYRKKIFFYLAALVLAAAGLITKFSIFYRTGFVMADPGLYGSYFVGSNFILKSFAPDQRRKLIALSFDDGPDAAQTGNILTTLKGCGVEAAFCIGKTYQP